MRRRMIWGVGIAVVMLLVIGLLGGFHLSSSPTQTLEGPNQPSVFTPPQGTTTTASWAYPFVRWNERKYAVSITPVPKVGQQLGSVTTYSNNEVVADQGASSNVYAAGTKLFAIPNVDPAIKIAIQTGVDTYVAAVAAP